MGTAFLWVALPLFFSISLPLTVSFLVFLVLWAWKSLRTNIFTEFVCPDLQFPARNQFFCIWFVAICGSPKNDQKVLQSYLYVPGAKMSIFKWLFWNTCFQVERKLQEGRQGGVRMKNPHLSGSWSSYWCQAPKVNLRWARLLIKDLLAGHHLQVALAPVTAPDTYYLALWNLFPLLESRPLLAGGQEMALWAQQKESPPCWDRATKMNCLGFFRFAFLWPWWLLQTPNECPCQRA